MDEKVWAEDGGSRDVTTVVATVVWHPMERQRDGEWRRARYWCEFSSELLGSVELAANAAQKCATGLAHRLGPGNVLILWN